MPFNPNEPQNGEVVDADLLRNQLNSLKALIDAVTPPSPTPETDPVFAASEAALLVPGDKAKLDAALQPAANINVTGNIVGSTGIFYGGSATCGVVLGAQQVDLQIDPGGNTQPVLQGFTRQLIGCLDPFNPVPTVAACWADGVLRDGAGNAFSTGVYSPANAGDWAGTPPATLAAMGDRLAAAYAALTGNPVP